jgi:3-oxoacyl-[acyl-carrier-protein] synthase III
MQTASISYLDYYIPEQNISVDDFLQQVNDAQLPPVFPSKREYAGFIDSVLQLSDIPVEQEMDETAMLSLVICRMFDRQVVQPSEIDMIIMLSEQRANGKTNPGQFLQYKFGMSNAMIINLSGNHCANLDVAISLAGTLCQGNTKNILILCATRTLNPVDRIIGTYAILGDAAGLVLINKEKSNLQLKDHLVMSKGMLHEANMVKDNSLIHSKYIRKEVGDILKRNGLTPSQITRVLIQNANPLLITHSLSEMGFNPNAIFTGNFGKYSHLDTVDLLVNLQSVLELETGTEEQLVMTIGMGWAGTYVTSLMAICN